jgi:hypothetical protein
MFRFRSDPIPERPPNAFDITSRSTVPNGFVFNRIPWYFFYRRLIFSLLANLGLDPDPKQEINGPDLSVSDPDPN